MASRGVIWILQHALAAIAALAAPGPAGAAVLGATVRNVADITYSAGGPPVRLTPPPATFQIEAARTPSTIEFLRYAPSAPDAVAALLNGSDYRLTAAGAFQPTSALRAAGGAPIDRSRPVKLTAAAAYFAGEPIILRLTDSGQNGDPTRIETAVATVASGGRSIALRLYESGPDTGQFLGWIGTQPAGTGAPQEAVEIAPESVLIARYQDPFDPADRASDRALGEPHGRLFDSATGVFVDGASVTLVDAATGAPARVLGIDGVSSFPSTIVAGKVIQDSAGMTYPAGPGRFVFPILLPGVYRVRIAPPPGYSAPSAADAAALANLPNGPFAITAASFGEAFTVAATGPVAVDVPLDPIGDIVVRKTADVAAASIGDFVRYSISVENRAGTPAVLQIVDELPAGFRYQPDSVRLGGMSVTEPTIASDGRTLTFALGLAPPSSVLELSYVVEVAAGARPGIAVNRALAIGPTGAAVSNRAEAAIAVEDGFLRSGVTILGRVVEGCVGDRKGTPGVRLYLETGATVVTDEGGRYHFEDVSPRPHVVQIDEASLPPGYALADCSRNTRTAGSIRSQFVDVQGGAAWRADFYLEKRDVISTPPPEPAFNADTEHRAFDRNWLNQQPAGAPEWAYPKSGVTPSSPSINIGLKHDAALTATLTLNGRPVPAENFAGRETAAAAAVALTRWRGVDLSAGENKFEAVLTDPSGAVAARLERNVDYVERVERVTLLRERTHAFADGRTRPVLALHVTDAAGRAVRAGRIVKIAVAPPYRLAAQAAIEARRDLDAPLSAVVGAPVGQAGVLLVELEPTVATGLARIEISLDSGASETITAFVKPALRDWIVVGLAEGEGGLEKAVRARSSPHSRDLIGRGRIAGFAKGAAKGGWLLTIAGDSAKKRGASDDDVFEDIDPDERYPLYGDRSDQSFEAQSRYPVYLKAEKDAFKAEFGDYDTGLTDSKLGRYSRRLSGLQTLYRGDRFSFSGFAAETNQAFVKDEIAADGGSGPFQLSSAPIVRNSETIRIETRDRFRPDVVIEAAPLLRYADYDIDYQSGELILRLPIPAADAAFNPKVIVADYESAAPTARNLTAGGRAAMRLLRDRVEVGATLLHEDSPDDDGRSELIGVDTTFDITKSDSLRVEYAATLRDSGGATSDAVLIEASHTGERVVAKAYLSDIAPKFGLGQQSTATAGARRFGAEASVRIATFEQRGARGARWIDAKAYREENLVNGARRDLAEIGLRQDASSTSGVLGLRGLRETPQAGPIREGLFAIAGARQRFDEIGLSLRAAREQPIAGEDASALFPQRTSVGVDQRLLDGLTLSATHEILNGAATSQANTTVGLVAEPWTGAKITAAGDRLSQDSSGRLGATFAVDQQVRLSQKWTGSLGLARREDLNSSGPANIEDDIAPDRPRSPFESAAGDFTSFYVGAGYRGGATAASTRFELKNSDAGRRHVAAVGAAREISQSLSFGAAGRFQEDRDAPLGDQRRFDLRFGAALRPREDGPIALTRLDLKQQAAGSGDKWKVVHTIVVNALHAGRFQISVNHGVKYAAYATDDVDYGGVTELLGAEARYDLSKRIDFGIHGEALYSFNAETLEYSYGPSIGFTPADNVWLTFGWNFEGFADEDFPAADFSRAGPYLKLRIKFDQKTAQGLLAAISPERAP